MTIVTTYNWSGSLEMLWNIIILLCELVTSQNFEIIGLTPNQEIIRSSIRRQVYLIVVGSSAR